MMYTGKRVRVSSLSKTIVIDEGKKFSPPIENVVLENSLYKPCPEEDAALGTINLESLYRFWDQMSFVAKKRDLFEIK